MNYTKYEDFRQKSINCSDFHYQLWWFQKPNYAFISNFSISGVDFNCITCGISEFSGILAQILIFCVIHNVMNYTIYEDFNQKSINSSHFDIQNYYLKNHIMLLFQTFGFFCRFQLYLLQNLRNSWNYGWNPNFLCNS